MAQEAILAKGFDATSIEEIVAGAEITRSGFFYHFRDKNELARALLEASIELDRAVLTDVFRRGHELSDDPLHAFLIGLKLFAELMDDMPNGHPGCIVTTVCYQQRLFDREVRELNRQAVLNWRAHFLAELEAVAERYPPKAPVDLVALADLHVDHHRGRHRHVQGARRAAAARPADHAAARLRQAAVLPGLTPPPRLPLRRRRPLGPRRPHRRSPAARRRRAGPRHPPARRRRPERRPRPRRARPPGPRSLAAIGRDADGDALAADLAAAGVDCAWLCRHPGPTDRYLAIEGADGALHAGVADCAGLETVGTALLAPLHAAAPPGRLVVDGNLPAEVLAAALDAGPGARLRAGEPAQARRPRPALFARRLTLYLNRAEAEALCGRRFADSRSAAQAVRARGAGEAVVTDGAAPATATDGAGLVTLAPPAVAPRSVTGAGDAFVAAHLAARADGLDAEAALATALDAATRHITVALP